MLKIVFVACSLANPYACQTVEIDPPEGVSAHALCGVGAMAHIASWFAEHPGVKLARWGCTRQAFAAK